jgi:hypothetical protein
MRPVRTGAADDDVGRRQQIAPLRADVFELVISGTVRQRCVGAFRTAHVSERREAEQTVQCFAHDPIERFRAETAANHHH